MTPCMPHQELERELKAWEAQEAGAAAEAASEEQEAQRVRIEEFVAQQEGLSQSDISARSGKSVATASTMGRSLLSADTGEHAADTSFWVPQLTPQARTTLKKPDTTVRCPITAKPLRLKQLTPVKFTRLDESKDLRGQLTLTNPNPNPHRAAGDPCRRCDRSGDGQPQRVCYDHQARLHRLW